MLMVSMFCAGSLTDNYQSHAWAHWVMNVCCTLLLVLAVETDSYAQPHDSQEQYILRNPEDQNT